MPNHLTQALGVELMVDFTPGEPLRWAALAQMPMHRAGEGRTPVAYGATPAEALDGLHRELAVLASEHELAGEASVETEVRRADGDQG